jgi:hypothetical protein
MTTATELSDATQQIIDLERYCNFSVAMERFAYEVGVLHGKQEFFKELNAEIEKQLEKAAGAAEIYQNAAADQIEGFERFSQLRVGLNPSCGGVAILAIVPEAQVAQLKALRRLSRDVERFMWSHRELDVAIWTMATDAPDQDRIAHDFPLFQAPEDG